MSEQESKRRRGIGEEEEGEEENKYEKRLVKCMMAIAQSCIFSEGFIIRKMKTKYVK